MTIQTRSSFKEDTKDSDKDEATVPEKAHANRAARRAAQKKELKETKVSKTTKTTTRKTRTMTARSSVVGRNLNPTTTHKE